MSHNRKIFCASITLSLLTLAGFYCLYQTLFDLWMTAYPFANPIEWRRRLYERLAIIIVIGFLWSTLAMWLFRLRQKS